MTRFHLSTLPLIASAALFAAQPAHAESWSTHPGASCSSDGPTLRPVDGALHNFTPSNSGYATFSCPVPRNFESSGPLRNTYVYINFQATNGTADFFCKLRSMNFFGDVVDSDSLTVPKLANITNIKGHFGGPLQVNGPVTEYGYGVVLRCQVPNAMGLFGGIISYSVRH